MLVTERRSLSIVSNGFNIPNGMKYEVHWLQLSKVNSVPF